LGVGLFYANATVLAITPVLFHGVKDELPSVAIQ
jgi:hypothetical protein